MGYAARSHRRPAPADLAGHGSIHARLLAMAIAITVTVALAACSTRLVGGMDEAEANRVVRALERSGVPAHKSPEGKGREAAWQVEVAEADAPRARQILQDLSMPRARRQGFAALMEQDSIVPSASKERLEASVALGEEIALAIEAIPGVVEAIVILAPDLEGGDPVGAGDAHPRPGKAAVHVKVMGDSGIGERDVRSLVAGAAPGVRAEDVSVVVSRVAEPKPGAGSWSRLGPFVVSPSSRAPLLAVLICMAVLNVALGALVVVRALRSRKREPRSGGPAA